MRARNTKLPRFPLHVVTQVMIAALWPSRVTERRRAMTELSVPESCLKAPAPSGSSTNLPVDEVWEVPFAVIATRCFVTLGPAVATCVRRTIPVMNATTMCTRLMSPPQSKRIDPTISVISRSTFLNSAL